MNSVELSQAEVEGAARLPRDKPISRERAGAAGRVLEAPRLRPAPPTFALWPRAPPGARQRPRPRRAGRLGGGGRSGAGSPRLGPAPRASLKVRHNSRGGCENRYKGNRELSLLRNEWLFSVV